MSQYQASRFWLLWSSGVVVTVLVLGLGGYYLLQNARPEAAHADEVSDSGEVSEPPHVEVVRPQKGGMNLTTTQPGTVRAFEWADLYAEVTGYLKMQSVDIGDHVKPGQVLAVLDVPDLQANLERRTAYLTRAKAVVDQMVARINSAKADLREAEAEVTYANAEVKRTEAALVFRQSMYKRLADLLNQNAIAAEVVDEEYEKRDAALEAVEAAKARVAKANALVDADQAKVEQAKADKIGADADVKVAQAERDNAQVQVNFATIRAPEWSQPRALRATSAVGLLGTPFGPSHLLAAPGVLPGVYGPSANTRFDSIITVRNLHVGDFVRSASTGATQPLLRVQRTDLFRVVVMVPDPDVPYLAVGERAIIELPALRPKKLKARVSRIAKSEDPVTRLMRVEVDLRNTSDGKIEDGMFGNVTIILNSTDQLTLPSSAVINRNEKKKGDVFVVRKGRVHLIVVEYGQDDGVHVTIRTGLKQSDTVVLNPEGLQDGQEVVASMAPQAATKER